MVLQESGQPSYELINKDTKVNALWQAGCRGVAVSRADARFAGVPPMQSRQLPAAHRQRRLHPDGKGGSVGPMPPGRSAAGVASARSARRNTKKRLPPLSTPGNADRERFPVGILRRLRLPRDHIRPSGLMRYPGDWARFVQSA
jgi:hypothetical protein